MLTVRKLPPSESVRPGVTVSHEEFALLAIGAGIERKAYAPVLLDLRNQQAFTEYFAILSANSARQVSAVADGIRKYMRENFGVLPSAVDGTESLNWVLLDYGFAFVHVFQHETRSTYKLEEMWSKARLIPVDEDAFNKLVEKHGLGRPS